MESVISLTASCHRIHKDMQVSVRVYDVVKALMIFLSVLTQMYMHTLCTNIYIKFHLQTNDTSSTSKLSLCLLSEFRKLAAHLVMIFYFIFFLPVLYIFLTKQHLCHDLVTYWKEMKCSPKSKEDDNSETIRMNCEMKHSTL